MGHTSLYSCYISNVEPGGKITFDTHALGCSICVDITQDTMRLLREGKSAREIRIYADSTYSKYGPSNMPPLQYGVNTSIPFSFYIPDGVVRYGGENVVAYNANAESTITGIPGFEARTFELDGFKTPVSEGVLPARFENVERLSVKNSPVLEGVEH